MAKKKTSAAAFTSFRILGKKAQNLIHKAAELKKREASSDAVPLPADKQEADLTVRFSLISIAQATLVVLGIAISMWLVYVLRSPIILVLLAFFVAAVADPGVRSLERWGFPRGFAILLIYLTGVFVLLFLLVSLIPIIADQLQQIAVLLNDQVNNFLIGLQSNETQIDLPLLSYEVNVRLTELVRVTLENLSINKFTDALQILSQNMSSFGQGISFITRIAGSVGNFVARFIIVMVLAFFIQIEKEHIRLWVRSFFSSRYRAYLDVKVEAINQKIGQWARGQLLLGLAVGSLVFVALTILRIKYAVTLAVLAGFTEFIPYIGPFIAAIPAVLIAITQADGNWLWPIIVAGVYYVIQWCENNLLVPLIMKRAVGLSPIAIIFAMLMGLSFPSIIHPILGLLVAVPMMTIVAVFLEDFRIIKKP
jgi:predicted PurR-regulated permease PerM